MARTKPLLVSTREWLRQTLLARLRKIDQTILNDAALKQLADVAARNLASRRFGYGELNVIMASAREVIASLAPFRGPAGKPITATELKRLRKEQKLPRRPPWF